MRRPLHRSRLKCHPHQRSKWDDLQQLAGSKEFAPRLGFAWRYFPNTRRAVADHIIRYFIRTQGSPPLRFHRSICLWSVRTQRAHCSPDVRSPPDLRLALWPPHPHPRRGRSLQLGRKHLLP